ncbi:Glyoxylase, beta-lactamase superfamily II [Planococcus glaciei]|uniref:MBL fold metallo-hydrolase n=1 Tax=Planococcus glaciei TaxID=459472 RepID=UPI000890AA64|nr:MBL fold metallo-hydrolase [Planococcus glaciei]SDH47752.1 Glyoxylase, beta-lactamase superfamily II [Planococcus glaciei]
MTDSVRVIPIECKFGPTSAYAYYIDAPEPALIDTGVASSASQEIESVLADNGIRIEGIRWILLTHGHVDHLGGARAVWEKTGGRAEIVIPKKEARLLRDRNEHVVDYEGLQGKYVAPEIQEKHKAILVNDIGEGIEPSMEVVEGDKLSLGDGISITVVETPGHSIGSVTFVLDGLDWAFAADAVQVYGGAKSGIPTIEEPGLYRQSLQRLLQEVRPKRLYLGHHFQVAGGEVISPIVEEEQVSIVLQESLELDAKLAEVVGRHLSGNATSGENDSLYGPFASIAEEISYTGDPRNLPCAFFVTMNGYRKELAALQKK